MFVRKNFVIEFWLSRRPSSIGQRQIDTAVDPTTTGQKSVIANIKPQTCKTAIRFIIDFFNIDTKKIVPRIGFTRRDRVLPSRGIFPNSSTK